MNKQYPLRNSHQGNPLLREAEINEGGYQTMQNYSHIKNQESIKIIEHTQTRD